MCLLGLLAIVATSLPAATTGRGGHVLKVVGAELRLDDRPITIKGLRCSAALISDTTTRQLVDALPLFQSYGVNTVSVYVMGSRFADVKGYRPDATLDPVYAARLAQILEAADRRGMIVLVGCLYWSTSRAKEDLGHWGQDEANRAVANTVAWLQAGRHRHVFVDPDNEGMASRERKWSIAAMIDAGHAANPACVIAYNSRPPPPANADLAIHFSPRVPGKPYVETEGSPPDSNYWGAYSKQEGLYHYLNVGVYTAAMKASQLEQTTRLIEQANGYVLASTWLQAPPPHGPNTDPGGDGSPGRPGIRWWLEYLRDRHSR